MIAVLLVLGAVLPGCGGGSRSAGDVAGDQVDVVAAFHPLAEVAERVGSAHVRVQNLTPVGAEPHDFELASRDVDRIEDADLVLFLGGGFQPAVEKVAGRAGGRAVDLLEDGDGGDPHVWLDPVRLVAIVERVRDELVDLDGEHAEAYKDNAARFSAEVESLDADFRTRLASCERRVIVTSHDAFGHLARRYDLEQEAIAGLGPETEPDPRRLAELAEQVRASGVTTVFSEARVSPAVAETLAREAGVETAVLDPLEGLSDVRRRAGEGYVAVMRENLDALGRALGCS